MITIIYRSHSYSLSFPPPPTSHHLAYFISSIHSKPVTFFSQHSDHINVAMVGGYVKCCLIVLTMVKIEWTLAIQINLHCDYYFFSLDCYCTSRQQKFDDISMSVQCYIHNYSPAILKKEYHHHLVKQSIAPFVQCKLKEVTWNMWTSRVSS